MRSHVAVLFAATVFIVSPARGLTITFDYSHDTTGFFSDPARKNLLALAASTYNGFSDALGAITPGGTNTWNAYFQDPVTGNEATVANRTIPANTVVVYVGARDLPGSTLGLGGPGGYDYNTFSQSFADSVDYRGQFGDTGNSASATDFGRWGGAISFDSVAAWSFGTAPPSSGSQADFLSVAIHELGHVLGFGTADSFTHYISGNTFVGPAAKAKHGGTAVPLLAPVPGNPGLDHWADGTTSTINGFRSQETAMDPSITLGTRKYFTALDYAAMTDVGWQVRLPGDANTDGKVGADDFALIDRGFGKHLTGWANGDFNDDGTVTASDYLIIDRAYASQTGVLEPGLLAEREAQFGEGYAADLIAWVPEPGVFQIIFGATAVTVVGRGRSVRRGVL